MYIDLARVLGSDPTWGFSNVVADALGCTPVDLATPDELLLDPPPAQRCVHVLLLGKGGGISSLRPVPIN